MYFTLFLIFAVGITGGLLFEKIYIPKMIFFIILGVVIGPSVLDIANNKLLEISSYLRQIALVIILTRSGLSIDLVNLKKIGRPAILMCFVPACFEIIGVTVFAPLILDVKYLEALLMGSVVAACSPAIIIPRMLNLMKDGYGKTHHVPELILAGSSCDDIFVIVLFYAFKSLVATSHIKAWDILQIPISIVLGVALGLICGFLLVLIFKHVNLTIITKMIIYIGVSLGMIALENRVKEWISISSLLGIIVIGILILRYFKDDAPVLEGTYKNLWQGFEILLFVLVGCIVDINYPFSVDGAIIVGLMFISLIFRCTGVICCLINTDFTFKERAFALISYISKATVQASIGGIPLSEGLDCGNIVLTAAIIYIILTALIGSILMDTLKTKLLEKET